MWALLAGSGELPRQVLTTCHQRQQPLFIIAFEGQTDPALVADHPHYWTHLGAVSPILEQLHQHQVTHIIMAGAMKRPAFSDIQIDGLGLKLMAKMGLRAFGDDGLLSGIAYFLEEEGFIVVSPTDFVGNLLCPEGVLGAHTPSAADWQDIQRGVAILQTLGPLDVGQACVVQQGIVLGIEAIEGTAQLIERCGQLKRPGSGGVLVKLPKPQQNLKIDLPTIGPDTIHQVIVAGLKGIALQAGGTQILKREKVIDLANQSNLFIVGVQG